MRNLSMTVSAVLMIILQPITLIAMVIAPRCSGIEQQADAYKIVSICVFSGAYYLMVWRRQSLTAAIALPVSQIAVGGAFLSYINNLPMTCLQ